MVTKRLLFLLIPIVGFTYCNAQGPLLWGMTNLGGSIDSGAIFSYNIATGIETVQHSFGGDSDGKYPNGSLYRASNGLLYGMT